MLTGLNRSGRAVIGGLLLTAACLLAPARAGAQTLDSRWQAWLGCWIPVAQASAFAPGAPTNEYVCVVPGSRSTAVDLISISEGRIGSRDGLDVTGERRISEQDGCTGWEQAEWAPDGRRIYRRSQHQCPGGVTRSTTGLFGMTPGGDWLDIMSVTSGQNTGVRVLHYRPGFSLSMALPAETAAFLQQRTAGISTARTAVATPILTRDIVEVSKHVEPAVVQAWLSELGQKFEINARQLVALNEAGVSEPVTDLLVALAHPKTFALKKAPATSVALTPGMPTNLLWRGADCPNGAVAMVGCNWYDPFRYGYTNSYGYGYGRYGYAPYGSFYSGSEPVVIIVNNPSDGGAGQANPSHGQVVKGRGYAAGSAGDSGSSAASQPVPSTPTSASPTSSSAPSSSGSSSGSSTGSSGDSGSSSGERTAHPR